MGWIKDKIKAGIGQWGSRFMFWAGQEVFLKTILQSIPNYVMQVFMLSKGLCDELERLMNSYWSGVRLGRVFVGNVWFTFVIQNLWVGWISEDCMR